MKNLLKKLPTATVTFFLGILVATLVTQVVAHGGDTSLIHGCVKNTSGIVRIVGANDTCGNGETAVDWNKASPFSGFPVCPNCDLTGKVLTGLNMTRAYFIYASLSGLNLSNTILTQANLKGAELINTNLSQALLNEAQLGADFSGANLTNANLTNSDLGGAVLYNANFTSADLTNANLGDTSIQGTNFSQVQWNGANVTNVRFINADLTGSLNFSTTAHTGVVWSNTICPDGTNSNNNGATCEGHF